MCIALAESYCKCRISFFRSDHLDILEIVTEQDDICPVAKSCLYFCWCMAFVLTRNMDEVRRIDTHIITVFIKEDSIGREGDIGSAKSVSHERFFY